MFDSLFTWQKQIDGILSRAKQRLGQLYRCRSLFNCQDVFFLYKSWIRPALEYGSILYSSAASSHLNRLNSLQTRVENMCGFSIPTLASRRNASILGFTCRLLNGEGHGNLQSFCPSFQKEILNHRYLSTKIFGHLIDIFFMTRCDGAKVLSLLAKEVFFLLCTSP